MGVMYIMCIVLDQYFYRCDMADITMCRDETCKKRVVPALQLIPCTACAKCFCELHRGAHHDTCSLAKKADADARTKAAERLVASATTPSRNLNPL